MTLPTKLQEIVDDIASMSREEKLETLIAYAESMPDLSERFIDERSKHTGAGFRQTLASPP